MQKTWIDNEGFVRLRSEGNQFVYPVSPLGLDPFLLYDSWDSELAVKMITLGYNLDFEILWDEAKDWPEGSTGLDSARASTEVYDRGMSIAESSICAGVLKTSDTPANWLAWAKRKGYKTDHLSPRKAIVSLERALDVCKVEGVIKSYTEQIEKLKQLAQIIEPFQADTQPQAVPVVPAPVVAVGASDEAATTNWKMRVQAEAASLFRRLRASGASPTVHSILGEMVKWCRTHDVKTDGGIYPTPGYLRTHVLAGKHWTPPR